MSYETVEVDTKIRSDFDRLCPSLNERAEMLGYNFERPVVEGAEKENLG